MIRSAFKKVAVGVSGGVDSAVSALLLKNKGYNVVGVFMKNWDIIDETGVCSVEKDLEDAKELCNVLRIPFCEVNFVKEYWTEVFDKLINDYREGVTPNPDILCNKNIKFKYFIDFSMNKLGAEAVATGHYARSVLFNDKGHIRAKLLKARDPGKDQTFFLSQIPQFSLRNTLFPIGSLMKSEVKKIALDNNLGKFARKKESMGICFIGRRNFQNFISEYIEQKEGCFIDVDSCKIVGKHLGKHNWTVGQRCKIAGCDAPYYIGLKIPESEDILVAKGHDHPFLFSDSLTTTEPFWIHSEPDELEKSGTLNCQFRFQHRDPLVDCRIYKFHSDRLYVKLDDNLRAITPGQYAVFYNGEECLGSARIVKAGSTEYNGLQVVI